MSRKSRKTGLTLDFGGSGTKGIAHHKDTKCVLYMEPQVIEVPSSSLEDKTQKNLNNTHPENIAYVGIGEDYRAVGYLAQLFLASPSLRPRKYELAVYKTLAAAWVMQQKLKLPDKLDLSLILLLPPGEFEDAALLKSMLKDALASFSTPTGTMNVNLVRYECFPEGSGIYMMYRQKRAEQMKRWNVGIVQIGYRNASVLLSSRGVLDKGKTTNLGMARMVELVQSRTSGLNEVALLNAIAIAGNNPQPHHFLDLVSMDNSNQQLVQVQKIIAAIKEARTEYAIALISWLKEMLPPFGQLSGIIIGGGTADYLRDELVQAVKPTTLVWHGEVRIPPEFDSFNLGSRLADAWALSEYHAACLKERTKKEVATGG